MLIPRFELRVVGGGGGEPAAIAPQPGGPQTAGETSSAAESQGVSPGMRLGEALARCPSLRLVTGDPARVADLWEGLLRDLEGIGAEVESERAGEAFFAIDGLRRLHGGEVGGVLAAARTATGLPVRIAAAPSRFAAFAAATRGSRLPRGVSESGAEAIVPAGALRAFLSPLPVSTLAGRLGLGERQTGDLLATLKRLGIRRLGELAALTSNQVADRFGAPGLRALRLARGEDTPLRPRPPYEGIEADIELPDGLAGHQLNRALELLVDRLLAHPGLEQRMLIRLRLSARLCGGGSWSTEQGLGRPTGAARKIGPLLVPHLERLPGPAEQLALRALALGPKASDQLELTPHDADSRRSRLVAAVREVRVASGPEALLKVVDVEPGSRIPERRFFLSPFQAR